ncbi:MAG: hypothetical protein ACK4WF_07080 [Candidatus Brocadiales bacterium]
MAEENKFWIQSAIRRKGALRKALKVKAGKKIPYRLLLKASKKGGLLGRRARLAMTLRKLRQKKVAA